MNYDELKEDKMKCKEKRLLAKGLINKIEKLYKTAKDNSVSYIEQQFIYDKILILKKNLQKLKY